MGLFGGGGLGKFSLGNKLLGSHGDASVAGEFFGSEDAIKQGLSMERAAMEALNFEREMADILRQDIQPLVGLRDQSLTEALNFLRGDTGDFEKSAEFTGVRNAALMPTQDINLPQGARRALADRATSIAMGELQPFTNRIFRTADISSAGVGGTNTLLQQNVEQMANQLAQSGQAAAGGILDQVAANQQGAMGLAGLLGSLCDERCKENKKVVRIDSDGLKVYQFNYIGDDSVYESKMAQDVQKVDPDHVFVGEDGYLRVSPKYAAKRVA